MVVGTIDYMSPEQARGAELDERSDQFSLGTVMYEMLTGVRPFQGGSAPQTLTAIIEKAPAPLERGTGDIPMPLKWVVERCLSKDPPDRYASTLDLARDLQFALEHLSELTSTPAAGPAAVASEAKFQAGRRAGWIALGALLGIAATMATVTWLRTPPLQPAPLRIITFSGSDQAPAASPDGRTIVFSSARDGVWRLWMKQASGGIEVPLTTGPDTAPRFSPDGSSVLFARLEPDGTTSLYRVPALGGEPRKAVHDALAGDWSPDGREIAFVRWSSTGGATNGLVGLAGVDGGNERVIHRVDNVALAGIRFSPDGEWVACNVGQFGLSEGSGKSILLLRKDGSETRQLFPPLSGGDLSVPVWLRSGREIIYAQGESVTTVSIGTTLVNSGATRFWRQDVNGGQAGVLFWTPSLVRVVDLLSAGRLVFDAATAKENLLEYDLSSTGAGGVPLSQGASLDRQPTYSPDGAWIAFSSNRSGNLDIWTRSTATGAIRRLTDDDADDWDPAYTPDGERMIWTSRRSGNFEIWMSNADGSGARQVTRDGVDAENATMTRDGAWLVYNSGNPQHPGLWKIRPDGSDATQLVSGTCQWPEVSPDGRHVSYAIPLGRDLSVIRVVSIEDGTVVPFELSLTGGASSNGRHRWMPDGRAIVFSWTTGNRTGVYAQDFTPGADTMDSRRELVPLDLPSLPESFGVSPDGARITVAVATGFWSLMTASDLDDIEPPRR